MWSVRLVGSQDPCLLSFGGVKRRNMWEMSITFSDRTHLESFNIVEENRIGADSVLKRMPGLAGVSVKNTEHSSIFGVASDPWVSEGNSKLNYLYLKLKSLKVEGSPEKSKNQLTSGHLPSVGTLSSTVLRCTVR